MLTYSMGGPSIDTGACNGDNSDVVRYIPPVPEFEVIILSIDPGNTLKYPNPKIPSVMIILEGSGKVDGELCRPGQSYYWPANGDTLRFEVCIERRGSMKIAIAHKNTDFKNPL